MAMYYLLVDVNPYYYNCGHYPDWVVEERQGDLPPEADLPRTRKGRPLAHATQEAAQEQADRMNDASHAAWHAFLDG
jgi:riboflavin biosynthesis pyrimidine reductase